MTWFVNKWRDQEIVIFHMSCMKSKHGLAMGDGIVVDHDLFGINPFGKIVFVQKPVELIPGFAFSDTVLSKRKFRGHTSAGRATRSPRRTSIARRKGIES